MAALPHRILIIKPSALGDIITVLPALNAIKKTFPHSHITWMVNKNFAQILENHPQIDDLLIFERAKLANWWRNKESFKAFRNLVHELRNPGFDIVLDMQGLFRTGFFSLASAASLRIGSGKAREMAWLFYNKRVKMPKDSIHVVDQYMTIAEAAGVSDLTVEFCLPVSPEDMNSVRQKLSNGNVRQGYAVLVPGASFDHKIWPAERFAEVADVVTSKYGLDVVLAGSEGEVDIAKRVAAAAKSKICNMAGKTTLTELTALLKEAEITISNDTGPAHISYAVGTKTIVLYGFINPKRLYPYGSPESIICPHLEKRGTEIKDFNPQYAIGHITSEEVIKKLPCFLEHQNID